VRVEGVVAARTGKEEEDDIVVVWVACLGIGLEGG